MALRNLGIEHEVVAIAEIDKFAIKSYEAIHGETNNLGDISQINTEDIPDHDLFTYSFPCQDISVAGKGLGLDEGSGTRSGLLWECQKVIAVKKPKYLLLENVKNLVGKRHKPNFDKWLEWLEGQGYTNYHQILNAKDYGIPQNRERVFVVSILGEHEPYKFPEPQPLTVRLKDILEIEVDEKFYLAEAQTKRLIQNSDYLQDSVNEPKINVLAHRKNYRRNTQVFDPNGITETLDTGQGGGRGHYTVSIPDLIIDDTQGYDGTRYYTEYSPTLRAARSGLKTIGVKMNRSEVKGEQDVASTLLARDYKGFGNQDMNGAIKPINPLKDKTDYGWHFEQQVYDENGITRALKAGGGSGNIPKVIKDEETDGGGVVIAASRGRNPQNPSDRTVGNPTEQRLEINKQGTSNTITTVQKDNYVVEAKEEYGRMGRQAVETLNENDVKYSDTINPFNKRVSSKDGISPTLTTRPEGFKTAVLPISKDFRIRKLTPKECWRLMGFSDDDFHKAEEVNSNTQLYKQAGNSIVVDVLEGIFKQLLEVAE